MSDPWGVFDQPESDKGKAPTTSDPWGVFPEEDVVKPVVQESSLLRRAADPLISAAKGTLVGIPEMAVGLLDIPTLGRAGQAVGYGLERLTGGGFKEAGEAFDRMLTPETRAAQQRVAEAKDFIPSVVAGVQNPSAVVSTIAESIPSMVAGAGVGGAVMKGLGLGVRAAGIPLATKASRAITAGAVGEGTVTAGQNTEQLRQLTADGTISPAQAAIMIGSGAVTGIISRMSGGLARRLGIPDADALLQGVNTGNIKGVTGILKALVGSAITEGALEELPQSAQEQMAQNIALGKPAMEGVAEAGAAGLLAGAGMGMMGVGGAKLLDRLKPNPIIERLKEDPQNLEINKQIEANPMGKEVNVPSPTLEEQEAVQDKVVQEPTIEPSPVGLQEEIPLQTGQQPGGVALMPETLSPASPEAKEGISEAKPSVFSRMTDEQLAPYAEQGVQGAVDEIARRGSVPTEPTVPEVAKQPKPEGKRDWKAEGEALGLTFKQPGIDENGKEYGLFEDPQRNNTSFGVQEGQTVKEALEASRASWGKIQGKQDSYLVPQKEALQSKQDNQDAIKGLVKNKAIGPDDTVRFTNVRELDSILKTGTLYVGEDFEGREGISAQKILDGENLVAYGKNDEMSAAIIFPKEAFESTGEGVNEVKINPSTDPNSLSFVVGGRIVPYSALAETLQGMKAPSTAAKIDVAAKEAATSPTNAIPEPTQAQKDAGNYKMAHVNVQGLDISIENPAGSVRKGEDETGKPFETPLANHYGYIKGTKSNKDGKLDVYIGPKPESQKVFVVVQQDPRTKKFDEHKSMLGWETAEEAMNGYLDNYDASGPDRIKNIIPMSMDQFKQWTKGDVTKELTRAPKLEGAGTAAVREKIQELKVTKAVQGAIAKVQKLAKTLGDVDLGEIKYLNEDRQVDYNTPEGKRLIEAWGLPKERLDAIKNGTEVAYIDGQHVVYEVPDAIGGKGYRSYITLFRGHTARTVYHEGGHALHRQGYLRDKFPSDSMSDSEAAARYVEQMLTDGKETELMEVLHPAPAKTPAGNVEAARPPPAAKKVKGSESLPMFNLKTKKGTINNPAMVLAKLKNDNPLESQKQIEKIAKKADQWREVTKEGWKNIFDALRRAPTVGELAATGWAGRAARWWYQDDEKFFKKVLGDDTYKFFGVMAATSPQAKAETENIRYGVNAWTDYVNLRKELGRDPNREEVTELVSKMDIGMENRRGGVIRALMGEQLGKEADTLKTRFYHNALFGIELGAVLDIWHGRGMGQLKFQKEGSKIALGQDFGDSIVYSVLADRMDKAAATLNLPQSASQASQWSLIKALWDRMGNSRDKRKYGGVEALKSITNRDVALAGNYTTGIANYFKEGHPIIDKLVALGIPREEIAKLKTAADMLEERGIDPKESVYHGAPPAIQKELERLAIRLEKTRDIIDTLKAQEAFAKRGEPAFHMALETTHGPFAGLPWPRRMAMHNEIRKGPLNDMVIKALGVTFGLKVLKVVDGPGLWYNPKTKQAEVNPNYTVMISVPPGKVKVDLADRIKGFGATLGHVTRQAAVGFTHPVAMEELFEAAGGPVVTVDLGRVITKEQGAAVTKAIGDLMPENSAFVVPTDTGMIISMPKFGESYPMEYPDFIRNVHKVLDTARINNVKGIRYSEKDILEGGDLYEDGRTGQRDAGEVSAYTDQIVKAGGPRALGRADKLLSRIDKIKEKYATRAIKRELYAGRPPVGQAGVGKEGVQEGVDFSLRTKLSKKEAERVAEALAKDPSIGTFDKWKNKTVTLTHWSKQPNLTKTDPKKHGTGAAGEESKKKSAYPELWIPRTYYGYEKYTAEPGLGRYRYTAEVPGNSVYDAWEDPLKLYPSSEETRKMGYYTGTTQGMIHEQRIFAAGFKGYAYDQSQAAAIFTPEVVTKVEPSEESAPQAQEDSLPDTDFSLRTRPAPKNTEPAYKLFRVKKSQPGKLFPMYADITKAVPVGEWLDADIGKTKMAPRPGWHTSDLPGAWHIGKKNEKGKIDRQHPDTVWAEVEIAADRDWQKEADSRGTTAKTKEIRDQIPTDGFYRYKTNPNMKGEWMIAGAMKVNRVLDDSEVDQVLAEAGEKPIPREGGPIDLAKWGFQSDYSLRTMVSSAISAVTGRPAMAAPASTNQRASWDSPEPSMINNLTYTLLDRQIDLRDVVKAITNFSGSIIDTINASLKETLYSGRVSKRVDDFLTGEIKPVYEAMAADKIERDDMEIYLHNRHAPEANKRVRDAGGMQDGGSGIMDADATAYMAALDPALKAKYERIARMVDEITHKNAQTLVEYGLETQDTIDRWFDSYEHYVPLFREDIEGNLGSGTGFSITGPSSKERRGSSRKVVDILANIANQRERYITRGEKNIISKALYALAKLNPNPDFWKIAKPGIKTEIDVDTDEIVRTPDLSYKKRDNVVMHRVIERGKVVEKGVEFNPHDPRAKRMAEAIKNIDMDTLGALLGTTAKATRFIAAMNTQYNPVFGVTNFIRDMGTAMFNLTTTPIAGKQKDVMKYAIPALKGIYEVMRAKRTGTPVSTPVAKLFEEFQLRGGQTGYRDVFKTTDDRSRAIERELNILQAGKVLKMGYAVKNLIADYNTAMENAIRLSAYKVGIESGMGKDQAAAMAKGLTVNFNKKGQIATQAGAMYAFFNASIQGTARMAETLAGPMGRRIVAGGMLFGVIQAAMLAAAGFEDDEPPEWVQERNIIIPLGGKKYATIPMPLGFNILPNIGRVAAQVAMSGFQDADKRIAGLVGSIFEAANPMGASGFSLQTITPTVIDPLAALSENKDWTGKKIYREDFSSLNPTPGFTRAREKTDSVSKAIAWGLNKISGGTDHKPGLFSPTPEEIQYLAGQVTGGVGREIIKTYQTTESLATGEETPPHRIPLVSRFYGDTEGKTNQANKFYDNIKNLNIHERELKDRNVDRQGYLKDHPEAGLWRMANRVENSVSELNKRRRLMIEREAPKELIKNMDNLIAERMRTFNEAVARARR